MTDIDKPPKSPKTVQTITPMGGGMFNDAAGGETYDLFVKKHAALVEPGSPLEPFPAALKELEELQGLEDEEAMLQSRINSPRRRKMLPMRNLHAGSYADVAAGAVNDAVKPVISNALIVSSINCFIAFIGLFIETYETYETAKAGTSSGVADASSGSNGSNGSADKTAAAGNMRSEEIYAGLMSSLRAFLHVAFLIMIFQVIMGRLHLKRVYTYLLFFWCTVLSVCYVIIKTASADDFSTWFSAEITIHASDALFFGFSCYVLSVTRAEASEERD